MGFLVEPQNQGRRVSWLSLKTNVDRFPGLGLKTGNCGLVIWTTKSPRWFLGLGFKTKRAMVSLLHHKTDGRRMTFMARDMHRDLAACFTWKQARLVFPSLPQNWQSDDGWCTWHHHGGHMKMKSKRDGSMQ
jgi:hypothetical protein